MRSKKAALIINPRTGQNVAKLPDLLAVLSAAGMKTEVMLKEYGKHIMELSHEASDGKKDLVIAYGGDGTLNQVVNGVMSGKRQSVVGIIPGGTANVWAGEIGVPTDPVKAALALANSEERKVDVGRIEVHSLTFPGEEPKRVGGNIKKKATKESSSVRHHFLLMAGIGIDAAIMSNVSKPLKYRVGPFAVGLSAAQEIGTQHTFPIEIRSANAGREDEPMWKGEALQVVIGNTRRYAKVAQMTPNAYIDDGSLDVCVLIAGDPISKMQQLSSLLLRLKPDNTTAEYFHGAHLLITVPSTVPFQVDGSPVKLKDYLSKADYERIEQAEKPEEVMVTYQFDAVRHALEVAVPCTYNNELFEESGSAQQPDHATAPLQVETAKHMKDESEAQTQLQKHTETVESQPESVLKSKEDKEEEWKKAEELRKNLPDIVQAMTENGRKFTVLAKAPQAGKKGTYIIAGTLHKPGTDEPMPAAITVNEKTTLISRDGECITDVDKAIQDLLECAVVVVEGKRNKWNAIRATRLVL